MSTRAVILGGGRGVFREAAPFLETSDIIAVNRTGIFLDRIEHWVSVHGDLLESMARVRRPSWDGEKLVANLEGIRFHSAPRDNLPDWIRVWDFREDGSSGLFATLVALQLYERVIVCGVPLTDDPGEYGTPRKVPVKYSGYRKAWDEYRGDPRIRATAGYTRELFGPPEEGFI